MRKVRIGTASLILLTSCLRVGAQQNGAPTQEVSLRAIEDSLAARGPKQTLRSYFDCSSGKGYSVVESGDPRAVALAIELLDSSDACVTESLASSLATAMQANPEAVLPYLPAAQRHRVAVESFCVPFIDADTPRADARAVLDRSERAVLNVHRPDLEAPRQSCLDAIRRYRMALDRTTERHTQGHR